LIIPDTTPIQFSALNLHSDLQKALQVIGFTACTPIQAATLPLILAGDDMAGQAQTGTGKTAAFLLATMQYLLSNEAPPQAQPRALIMSPTRELAIQIYNDALLLNQFTNLSVGLVYGGVDYLQQRDMVAAGVDILVGTPGRLIDYQKQGVLKLKYIEVMVLDEADRMFDLGFIKDIRFLLRRMPDAAKRLNMLFSATLSYRVTELAYEHMNNPDIVRINPEQVTADRVTQCLYHVSKEDKAKLLFGLLRRIDPTRTIVFVNTKRTAELIWGYLESNGYQSAILSGDVPQKKRQTLFKDFSEGRLPILVATDLAARGLHIPEVSHIFNYDMPQNAEDYVHRIGRTARAGAAGDAVSLACEEFVFSLPEIEEFIGQKIPTESVTDDLLMELKPPIRLKRAPSKFNKGQGRDSKSRPRRPRQASK
jgi:ATP-dependent RNA helicase RhlB